MLGVHTIAVGRAGRSGVESEREEKVNMNAERTGAI